MESESVKSGTERKLFEALEATEPHQATAALEDLTSELHAKGVEGLSPVAMWNRFKRLLHRRGYYVDTPARLSVSLGEIQAVGEGFDLFDLARSLAAYDDARKESRGPHGHHALPQLRRFAQTSLHPKL
jgi:hypothetical protein